MNILHASLHIIRMYTSCIEYCVGHSNGACVCPARSVLIDGGLLHFVIDSVFVIVRMMCFGPGLHYRLSVCVFNSIHCMHACVPRLDVV